MPIALAANRQTNRFAMERIAEAVFSLTCSRRKKMERIFSAPANPLVGLRSATAATVDSQRGSGGGRSCFGKAHHPDTVLGPSGH